MASVLIKSVSRVEAAHFSRRLSKRVFLAQSHGVTLGFWRGGPAPFGYRRQAVGENGAKRALLKPGEQKHFRTERVILVPGPKREIEIVRRIFRDFAICRKIRSQIADELNARGIYNSRGKPCIPTLAEIVGPAHLDRLKAKRRMLVHHHMVYSARHRPR